MAQEKQSSQAANERRSLTMKKRNIYLNQSQELLSLFEDAGNNSRSHVCSNGLRQKGPYCYVL